LCSRSWIKWRRVYIEKFVRFQSCRVKTNVNASLIDRNFQMEMDEETFHFEYLCSV
jgi:hypothetical protein